MLTYSYTCEFLVAEHEITTMHPIKSHYIAWEKTLQSPSQMYQAQTGTTCEWLIVFCAVCWVQVSGNKVLLESSPLQYTNMIQLICRTV